MLLGGMGLALKLSVGWRLSLGMNYDWVNRLQFFFSDVVWRKKGSKVDFFSSNDWCDLSYLLVMQVMTWRMCFLVTTC